MNVLVTGGAGFIGSHVVDAMVEAGHNVSVVDNFCERGGGKRENINPQATLYEKDILRMGLGKVFLQEEPEVVCHLAAQASVARSAAWPGEDANINVMGTLNLLGHCVEYGVRKVIFASSAATYGTVETLPVHEGTSQHPESPYGCSKLANEHYLRCWKKLYGLDYTIFRFGNVYGPRQDPTRDAGVVAIFANALLEGKPVRIDWDGWQSKDYVYVEDIARAHVLALTRGDDETYCLGTNYAVSVNRIYEWLTEITGCYAEVIHAPKRPGDTRTFVFDSSKAGRELGWYATVELLEGLNRTVSYFKTQKG